MSLNIRFLNSQNILSKPFAIRSLDSRMLLVFIFDISRPYLSLYFPGRFTSYQVGNIIHTHFLTTRQIFVLVCAHIRQFIVFITQLLTFIRITGPFVLNPFTPHFYIVKLGFTGVYIFFLFLLLNIDCGYSLEPPQ